MGDRKGRLPPILVLPTIALFTHRDPGLLGTIALLGVLLVDGDTIEGLGKAGPPRITGVDSGQAPATI